MQTTIARDVCLEGTGLHSGNAATVCIRPAEPGTGIVFHRVDLPGSPGIVAGLDSLVEDSLLRRTTIGAGQARAATIEHLLATLYALRVTNARIELDAEEPPFLDGSARPYVEAVQAAGVCELDATCEVRRIAKPVVFRMEEEMAEIVALPGDGLRVTFFFNSGHPLLRAQSETLEITPHIFATQIAPARTFCFIEEVEKLREAGLIRGGSLDSAVVFGRETILNGTLRFDTEPVRHKILDFIGDLSLLEKPVEGHFLAWRAGHRVNAAFGQFLRRELEL